MPVRLVVGTAPGLLRRRLSASSEMAPAVEVFFSRTTPEAVVLPGLLSMSSLLALLSLLSRDSNASEVEDFELFMPEGAAGRGRVRSVPWLPALRTGFQGLAALLMFVLVSPSSAKALASRASGELLTSISKSAALFWGLVLAGEENHTQGAQAVSI